MDHFMEWRRERDKGLRVKNVEKEGKNEDQKGERNVEASGRARHDCRLAWLEAE